MDLKSFSVLVGLVVVLGGAGGTFATLKLRQVALASGQQQNTVEIAIIKTKERYREAESEYIYYVKELRADPGNEYIENKASYWKKKMEDYGDELEGLRSKLNSELKGEWP